jgi:hypothetical protein
MLAGGNTTLYITLDEADWWSNKKPYQWGPFYGAGTYEARVMKTPEGVLSVRLKVPGEDEVTLATQIDTPKNGVLAVSLKWNPTEGFTLAQNGRNSLRVRLQGHQ